jgi:hypothetical protein
VSPQPLIRILHCVSPLHDESQEAAKTAFAQLLGMVEPNFIDEPAVDPQSQMGSQSADVV